MSHGAAPADGRIPVTVVGGYLGAGKTTLVNHLLRNAEGRRIAVLVNDFGELPIDADLIESQAGEVIGIAGGCVCCSFGSDLMGALARIARAEPAPEHVLVEASGVGLPGSVARSIALVPLFRIDSVAVLADCETVRSRAADTYMGDTITRQLAEADLVIANKADLVSPGGLAELHAWLARSAPQARVVEAIRGAVPPAVLFDDHAPASLRGAGRGLLIGAIAPQGDAAARYESASFTVRHRVDAAALARALTSPGCGVLRAKGVVRDLDGSGSVLHVVGARTETGPHAGSEAGSNPAGIACIGLRGRLDRDAIARAIAASRDPVNTAKNT
ncbi:MAG: GTP-binding protein [Betaproteobacteria bacterium]